MAEHQRAVEPEEQVDLDGDNDIEDMMDDEDGGEDEGYRKEREQFDGDDNDGDDNDGDDDDDDDDDEITEGMEARGSEGEGGEKVLASDAGEEASQTVKEGEEEKRVGPKDEEDRRKWAELLALPPHGSEVFIGGLPRNATEEDLRELCEPFGQIFEVREWSIGNV